MPLDQGALLVADIGTLMTHVALIDQVAGEYRLVDRAEALSTLEPPQADASLGLLQAVRQIERVTGRQLIANDAIMKPQRPDSSGVDAIICVSSAAGALPVVITAISGLTTGSRLRRIARSIYASLLATLTLDDNPDDLEMSQEDWFEQQIDGLAQLPAATVLMAGGVEGGPVVPLDRLAHVLALTLLRKDRADSREFAHVVFAGNSAARDVISAALSSIAPLSFTDNIQPTLQEDRLTPTRLELLRLYNDRVLIKLPGYQRLRAVSAAPLRTPIEGYGPVIRFVSHHHGRQVLFVDLGAMSTGCFAAHGDQYSPSIVTNCGTGQGALGVLAAAGADAILRWLPYEMTEQALREFVLNRLLRPQIVASTREELFVDQALAREALRAALAGLQDERPDLTYDLIVASGGALTHTGHPAEALLILLDVLQPDASNTLLITDVYLDRDGILPLCSALAPYNADAAFCLLEKDALRNGPLASCVVISGEGRPGELAVEAELTPVGGGAPVTLNILHGEVRRLPLTVGRRGTLRLKPAKGVRIGANEPGAEVQSEVAALHGSALGIVIDARGRPLSHDLDPATRRALTWNWLAQLGAVPTVNPYQWAAPTPGALGAP
ncbi:MAG TPA: glutamate mutase L, partial [Herpetosiphonaceae bacterium]